MHVGNCVGGIAVGLAGFICGGVGWNVGGVGRDLRFLL